MPTIRIWQPTPLTARRQHLIHTISRSTVCAIFASEAIQLRFSSKSNVEVSIPFPQFFLDVNNLSP